jgi:hypothetical protein
MLVLAVVRFSLFSHVFWFVCSLLLERMVFQNSFCLPSVIQTFFVFVVFLSAPSHTPFVFNCWWPVTSLPWRECCHWWSSVFLGSLSILTKHTRMRHTGRNVSSWKHVKGTNLGKHTRMRHTHQNAAYWACKKGLCHDSLTCKSWHNDCFANHLVKTHSLECETWGECLWGGNACFMYPLPQSSLSKLISSLSESLHPTLDAFCSWRHLFL